MSGIELEGSSREKTRDNGEKAAWPLAVPVFALSQITFN